MMKSECHRGQPVWWQNANPMGWQNAMAGGRKEISVPEHWNTAEVLGRLQGMGVLGISAGSWSQDPQTGAANFLDSWYVKLQPVASESLAIQQKIVFFKCGCFSTKILKKANDNCVWSSWRTVRALCLCEDALWRGMASLSGSLDKVKPNEWQ